MVAVDRVGAPIIYAVKSSARCTCRARLLLSSDDGASWTVVAHPPGDPYGAAMAFADDERGWMTDPDQHGRLYTTCDAARHWSPVPLTGVISVFAVHQWIYATTATTVYAATAKTGRFQAVASATGDVLIAGRTAMYAVPADKSATSRTITRIRHRMHDREPSACPAGSETVLAEQATARVILICAGEPSDGNELKAGYRQRKFGSPWHRTSNPTSIGYLNTALSSRRGVFYTGERSPLYLSANLGHSWHAVPTPADRNANGYVGGNFSDPYHGWLLSVELLDTLYLTNNAGETWHVALR